MRARVLLAIVLSIAAASHDVSAGAQQPTFTARSELVVLHVTVRSGRDGYVSDLPREAFAVVEDGRPQRVSFLAGGNEPVTVGLLIDGSASMWASRELVIAASAAFAEAGHPEDEVFALGFNDDVRAVLPADRPFTSDPGVIREALEQSIEARGRTALYDAISDGLDYVERGSRPRRALVVVSDGGDNASQSTLDAVLRKAQASNAVIYTVAIVDSVTRHGNRRLLRDIAAATGGQSFEPRRVQQLADVLERIASDLRHAYTVGYVPSNTARDGSFRRVHVAVTDPRGRRLNVRSRGGYLAGVPQGASQ